MTCPQDGERFVKLLEKVYPDVLKVAEFNMAKDRRVREYQKGILKQLYPDYIATRHDAFVIRHNEHVGKAITAIVGKNRGIEAHQPEGATAAAPSTSLESLIAELTDENHNLRTALCLYGKLVDENRELKAEIDRLKHIITFEQLANKPNNFSS